MKTNQSSEPVCKKRKLPQCSDSENFDMKSSNFIGNAVSGTVINCRDGEKGKATSFVNEDAGNGCLSEPLVHLGSNTKPQAQLCGTSTSSAVSLQPLPSVKEQPVLQTVTETVSANLEFPQQGVCNITSPIRPPLEPYHENTSNVGSQQDISRNGCLSEPHVQVGSNTKPKAQLCDNITNSTESLQLPPSVKERPVLKRVMEPVYASLVFFDLETTSLRTDCDITQLAAAHENETFSDYVIPGQPIEFGASQVTGLTSDNGTLYLHGKPVEAKPIQEVLQKFLEWIKVRTPVLLFAHNAQFDYIRFFHAISQHKLGGVFQKHVVGFVDTLGLFRKEYPGFHNYKQETLVRNILKEPYTQHDATEDVRTLQKLYTTTQPHAIRDFSCTFTSAFHCWQYNTVVGKNLITFTNMKYKSFVSEGMAKKMAASGLCLTDLRLSFERGGLSGLMELLAQRDVMGKPRVTNCKNVVEKMSRFFDDKNGL